MSVISFVASFLRAPCLVGRLPNNLQMQLLRRQHRRRVVRLPHNRLRRSIELVELQVIRWVAVVHSEVDLPSLHVLLLRVGRDDVAGVAAAGGDLLLAVTGERGEGQRVVGVYCVGAVLPDELGLDAAGVGGCRTRR